VSGDVNISHCKFVNNTSTRGPAAAIHYSSNNPTNSQVVFTINYCNFTHNKNVIYIVKSVKSKVEHRISLLSSTFDGNQDILIYLLNQELQLKGKNLFQNNKAGKYGGIYIRNYSTVIFNENSDVAFIQNSVFGVITLRDYCSVLFDKSSIVTFNDNTANSIVGFTAAIYSFNNSHVTFTGNSKVTFNNNAFSNVIRSRGNCSISFKENSTTMFSNNTAKYGGVIKSEFTGYISFEDNSNSIFSNNIAHFYGGSIMVTNSVHVTIKGNSNVMFNNNEASEGGAVHCYFSMMVFRENSTVTFIDNKATNGENLFLQYCDIKYVENCMVKFINNIATDSDRAVYAEDQSDITFDDNSTVTFTNNKVAFGASVYSYRNSKIIVKGNSTIIFNDLFAKWCANTCVKYTDQNDVITIDGTGTVWCSDQKAFICLSEKCHCNKLEDILADTKSHTPVNIKESKVALSSVIRIPHHYNISIIGHNNLTINCANKGALIIHCKNIMIKGITWIGCGARSPDSVSVIEVEGTEIIIQNCIFQHSLYSSVTAVTAVTSEQVFPNNNFIV